MIVFNTCSVREKAQEKVFADLGRRLEVVTERFLEHDPAHRRDEPVGGEAPGDCAEQARRCGEIDDAGAVLEASEALDESAPLLVLRPVGLHVLDAIAEGLPVRRVIFPLAEVLAQRLVHAVQVCAAAQLAPADGDDPAVGRELRVPVTVIQGRQQLAHRKVAGTAEDDQVENLDRN